MGCCIGMRNDTFLDKELIINLGPKEINDFLLREEENPKIIVNKKYRKTSLKTVETKAESPKKPKRLKKSINYHNQKIKDIAKNFHVK